MHNPVSVLENETHKLLWDFDIQTDHLISARRPDLIINNNKKERKKRKKLRTWKIVDFVVPADHRIKLKVNEKKDKYLNLAWELKKTMEHEGDNYINSDWCFWYSHQRIIKGTGGHGNKRTSGDHPNNYFIENDQNTEKRPVYLRRLADTQNPMKDHQLMLMWKTLKE